MSTRSHRSVSVQYAFFAYKPPSLRLPLTASHVGAGILLHNFSLLRKKIVRRSGNTTWADKILKRLVDPLPGRQAGCSRPSTLGIGLAEPGATTFSNNKQSNHLSRRTA